MACLNKNEFCNKLIETLKKKTVSNELKWSYFDKETNTMLDLKSNIFRYNKESIVEEYKDYQVNMEESVFCDIDYGKDLDKIMTISIVSIEKNLNNKVKILICDRENRDSYEEICNSNQYSEVCKLYETVEFKMVKEFKILEKWLLEKVEDK